MPKVNVTINDTGNVLCALCPPKADDEGKPILRDGATVEMDGAEMDFCWKHVRAISNMRASAKPKEGNRVASMIGNGQ